MPKRTKKFRSDKEAEKFLEQDLSGLDFTQFKPAQFDFAERQYLKSVEATLSEWDSREDSTAYDDLGKGAKKPRARRKR